MYVPEEFDYIKLMNAGREASDGALAARVAGLGFCTTQYYAGVLRGLGAVGGFPLVTYEPEYDTVHQTVLDEGSELYTFAPDFVVVLTAVQAVRNVLLGVDVGQRVEATDREAQQLISVIERVAGMPAVTVVVNEFVLPYERPWGNLSRRVSGSLVDVVCRMNGRLRELGERLAHVHQGYT